MDISGIMLDPMDTNMIYQIRKSRGINWTLEEKEYLVQLCCQRARIIEDKRSDIHTLRKKAIAWKNVYEKFSARFGRKRPIVRVKEQWKRMKIAARAEMRGKQKAQPAAEEGTAVVTLGEEDVPKPKYCAESEELLSQVQAILNSEFPENEVEDSNVDINESIGDSIDLTDDSIIIKQEYEVDDPENTNHGFFETELSDTSSVSNTRLEEFGVHGANSNPVPIHVTSKRQYSERRNANDSWEMYDASQNSDYHREFHKNPRSTEYIITRNLVSNSKRPKPSEVYSSHSELNGHNQELLAEYARKEHLRKMEIIEKEHQTRMEILKIEREIAIKKLRKAELKLSMTSGSFDW